MAVPSLFLPISPNMSGKLDISKNKNVVPTETETESESENEKDSGNDFGLSLEKLTLGPRKKLLVMNLSGLLLHRAFKRDTPRIPKHRRPDVVFGKHLGKTINTFMF